jgi:hypothetical protein
MAFPLSHWEVAAPSSRWARQLLVDVHFRLGEGDPYPLKLERDLAGT